MALLINIHEINQRIMKKIIKVCSDPETILTFDDGLFSQFVFLDELLKLPNKKYFYISTFFIHDSSETQEKFMPCAEAHQLAKETNNKKYYMTWDQIKIINSSENCFIGMHGHLHIDPDNFNKKDYFGNDWSYKKDVTTMIDKFDQHIKGVNNFAWPYNKKDELYLAYLTSINKQEPYIFYDRIDIEDI